MLRYFYINLNERDVVIPEGNSRLELAALLRDRQVQSEFCDWVGQRRLSISVSPDLCRPKMASMGGIMIPSWEPDPLIYVPFIDFVTAHGLVIGAVTMGGLKPFQKWILWADIAAGLILILSLLLGSIIHHKVGILTDVLAIRAERFKQLELNRLHLRHLNEGMVTRLKMGADWVRNHNGEVLTVMVTSSNATVDAVCPNGELDRIRDESPWIDAIPITNEWVAVHASRLD